jgi:hypothetical protein
MHHRSQNFVWDRFWFISTILQDGKIDEEDAKAWWRIIKEVLVYKLPSAGGFSLGFLYGARYA